MSEETDKPTPKEKYNRRIDVWRQTVQLFHTSRNTTGIFQKCGYKEYVIEGKLSSKLRTAKYKPDIIAWSRNPDKMLIVEITADPTSYDKKQDRIYQYLNDCEYQDAQTYGAPQVNSADVILTHPQFFEKTMISCEIAYHPEFQVRNTEKLNDTDLKKELETAAKEKRIKPAPDIGLSILPEMSDEELRVGLSPFIYTLFKPGENGKTATEITNLCLERFKDTIPVAEKNILINRVKKELTILIHRTHEYLAYDPETQKFHPTNKGINIPKNYMTKQTFQELLDEWIGNKSTQSLLTTFIDDVDEDR